MYHKNLEDTHENVFPKFKVTPEEQKVVMKAAKAYKIHRFKNRIVRDGVRKWTTEEILDNYFKKKGLPTDSKRWYELARCIMAIGEHQARVEMGL